jgi:hypothetical protein
LEEVLERYVTGANTTLDYTYNKAYSDSNSYKTATTSIRRVLLKMWKWLERLGIGYIWAHLSRTGLNTLKMRFNLNNILLFPNRD